MMRRVVPLFREESAKRSDSDRVTFDKSLCVRHCDTTGCYSPCVPATLRRVMPVIPPLNRNVKNASFPRLLPWVSTRMRTTLIFSSPDVPECATNIGHLIGKNSESCHRRRAMIPEAPSKTLGKCQKRDGFNPGFHLGKTVRDGTVRDGTVRDI